MAKHLLLKLFIYTQVGADLIPGFYNSGVGIRFVIGPNAGLLTVEPTRGFEGEDIEIAIAGMILFNSQHV